MDGKIKKYPAQTCESAWVGPSPYLARWVPLVLGHVPPGLGPGCPRPVPVSKAGHWSIGATAYWVRLCGATRGFEGCRGMPRSGSGVARLNGKERGFRRVPFLRKKGASNLAENNLNSKNQNKREQNRMAQETNLKRRVKGVHPSPVKK